MHRKYCTAKVFSVIHYTPLYYTSCEWANVLFVGKLVFENSVNAYYYLPICEMVRMVWFENSWKCDSMLIRYPFVLVLNFE